MNTRIQVPIKPNSKHLVTFDSDSISYRGKEILYREVEGIRHHVPFYEREPESYPSITELTSPRGKIKIKVAARHGVHNMAEIVALINSYVRPCVIRNALHQIFVERSSVQVGGFELDSRGITSIGLMGGKKFASWDSEIRVEGRSKAFTSTTRIYFFVDYYHPASANVIPIGSIRSNHKNALVLESLIESCREYVLDA